MTWDLQIAPGIDRELKEGLESLLNEQGYTISSIRDELNDPSTEGDNSRTFLTFYKGD